MALTPDKTRIENGLIIHEKIIPWGAVWSKTVVVGNSTYTKGSLYKADRLLSGGTGVAKGVTIHNTDGSANAETYTRATYPNQNMKDSRAHYYVDDVEAWQNLREDEVGWHAGDGRGNGNETTISIEIIMRGSKIKNDAASETNGAKLAAILLLRHGLTINQLYKHQDWSGKYCPLYIIPTWAAFKAKVQSYMAEFSGNVAPDTGGGTATGQEYLTYTVKAGDTLSKIAQTYLGLASRYPEIKTLNGLTSDTIHVGQVLKLPILVETPNPPTAPELDNTPAEWEKAAVEKAISRGIIVGDTSGNFKLHSAPTKAEVLVILERAGVL